MMKQILIIDDDIHIGNMLEETLKREGYRVSRAYSGTEALLVLSVEKPDLVLLDLMLPRPVRLLYFPLRMSLSIRKRMRYPWGKRR